MSILPQIIYEDNHIFVVIKQQGVPSQPDSSGDADLLSALKQHRKVAEDKAGEAFVGLVHRLDRVTGGVMVFAKTSKAAARLAEQMQGGHFEKRYLCVVRGAPKQNVGSLEHYLLKNENKNIVEVVGLAVTGAKRAELSYRVLSTIVWQQAVSDVGTGSACEKVRDCPNAKISLVEVELLTGRSHQIRAQLANIGHELIGDRKYGSTRYGIMTGITSQHLALWAYSLSFVHPTTGERMKFVVNPPEVQPWVSFDFNRKEHKHRGGVV